MTDPSQSTFKHETIEDGLLVYLQGDIEFSQSPRLRTQLIGLLDQQQPEKLIVELSTVSYMDSSGIAIIVEVLQWQRHRGHHLILVGLQSKVLSMLKITRLDQLFTIADDLDAAKQL